MARRPTDSPTGTARPGDSSAATPLGRAAATLPAATRLVLVALPAVMLLGLAATACGSRAEPIPPYDPVPPTIAGLKVAQRGYAAIVQLPEPPVELMRDNDAVPLAELQILVASERYPLLTAELLATALEEERQRRLEEARAVAAGVSQSLAAREAATAEAAGEEEEDEEEAAEAAATPAGREELTDPGQRRRSDEDEEGRPLVERQFLQRLPMESRQRWRDAGVRGEALVEAGRQLGETVAELWQILDLPAAIVDLDNPPPLPDRDTILRAARLLAEGLRYERSITPRRLLELDPEIVSVDLVDRSPLRRARRGSAAPEIHVPYVVGMPSLGEVRTRYFFGARTVTVRDVEGEIEAVAGLAPRIVPLPPTRVEVMITPQGVRLDWLPPLADLHGRLLLDTEIRYRVFRGDSENDLGATPLHSPPLARATYTDASVRWDSAYVYEVTAYALEPELPDPDRARPTPTATAPGASPGAATRSSLRREEPRPSEIDVESPAATTARVEAIDVFPPTPPGELRGARAGGQVTLQWSASNSSDVAGYRVYRHPLPAPPLPGTDEAPVPEPEEERQETTPDEAQEVTPDEAQEVTPDEAQEVTPDEARELRRQRRRQKDPLAEAGWVSLTDQPVTTARYVDPEAGEDRPLAYVVVAVDRAGNRSAPALVRIGDVPAQEGIAGRDGEGRRR